MGIHQSGFTATPTLLTSTRDASTHIGRACRALKGNGPRLDRWDAGSPSLAGEADGSGGTGSTACATVTFVNRPRARSTRFPVPCERAMAV